MELKIDGSPEDLIRRCDECEYCIFEDILTEEQRKIKVLKKKVQKFHVHRIIIEQICGKQYDEVCPMKYVAMRAFCDDRTAMQMGVVKNYVWDLGKQYKRKVEYTQALQQWTTPQDFGRGKKESYAKRYDKVWRLGLRKTPEGDKQILTSDFIYEVVIAEPKMYKKSLDTLNLLIIEHEKRDSL